MRNFTILLLLLTFLGLSYRSNACSVSISASSTTVCAGGSITFTGTITNSSNSTTYQWLKNGVAMTGTNNNGSITSPGNGTFTFTTSSLANGDQITCSITETGVSGTFTSNTLTITVNALPTVSAGSGVSICTGRSTALSASGAIFYTWSPTAGLSCTNCSGPSASPTVTTTYTVTGINGFGCTNSASVTVTVNALPLISAGSNVAICTGSSTTLTASGGVSYTWSPGASLSCTTCSGPSASPVAKTTYTLTGTDAHSCVNTATVTVSVNSLPTISAGSGTSICNGGSTTLSASGGVSYTWVPAASLSCTSCASPSASPTVNTTYTVTGTDAHSCVNTATVTVTVNALPTISAGSNVSICTGGATTLTASGGVFYTWSPSMGLSCFTCSSTSANPTVTTTYTVTGLNVNGCSNTATVTVTVNPLPTISAGLGTVICTGSSTILNASGGISYIWSPSTSLSCTNCTSTTASPVATITYTVAGTDGHGCVNTASVTITVNALPAISAGASIGICIGGATALSASGGVTYSWSPATGLSCTTCSGVSASPTTTTTYTLSGTDANSCVNSATVTVTVHALPSISAGSNVSICDGSSTTLTATGGAFYTWTPASGLSCITCASALASPTITTTYTVTGVNMFGCANTASVTVTVNPVPTISAGANTSICIGSSTSLTASGGLSYTWSPTAGLACTSCATTSASPATTTTYTVTGVNSFGCSNSAMVTVTVNPLPTINAGTNAAICSGGSTPLTASGGLTYVWTPAAGLSCNNCSMVTASPTVTTTYTVTGTNALGCSNTATVNVTVNPLPTISAGSNVSICIGGSTMLSASGGVFYTWSPSSGLSCFTCASTSANPSVTTTYTVTGMNVYGCINTAMVTVTVNALPTINAGSDVSVCTGSSTPLSGSGGATYSWSPSAGLSCTACPGPSASPTVTTTYTVIGTDAHGCVNTADLTVTVNPLPVVTAGSDVSICSGDSTALIATGGTVYSWAPSTDLSATTCASVIAKPTVTTTYTVTVTDGNGCVNSASVTVTVNDLPAAITGAGSVIVGSMITLNDATAHGRWTSASPGVATINICSGQLTGMSGGTTVVVYTLPTSCYVSTVVTVNPISAISGNINVCVAEMITLSDDVSGGTWSSGSTGVATIDQNTGVLTGVANGTAEITYTSGTGFVTTIITVNPLPTISAGSDVTICNGGSAMLSPSGGVLYTWQPTNNLSCTACNNPVASPTVTTTYTVTGLNSFGCAGTSSVTVSVNPLPAIGAGADVAICYGGSTPLSASGGVSYAWSPSAGLSCTTCSATSASPAATTVYTLTGTDANGCVNTATVTVTVNSLPAIGAGSGVTICNGGSASLSGSGGMSYTWSPTAGLSCTNCPGMSASPSTTTTYTVTGTDANGCVNTAAVIVSVNPLPVINAGPNVSICIGGSTTLSASGGVFYTWSPSSGLSCFTCSGTSASPTVTTTYTVTGMNVYGCTNTAMVTVTVNSLPGISAGSDVSICLGSSAALTATGGVSYSWSPADGLTCTNCSGTSAGPDMTTMYTLTGADANGCVNTASVMVTVNDLPVIDAGYDQVICYGSATSLSASGGVSFTWSPVSGLSCTDCPGPSANPSATTTYTVTGMDGNGCTSTSSLTVTVIPLPTISAGSDVSICYGDAATLTPSGGVFYLWTPADGLSCVICPSTSASPTITTTYTVTGLNIYGCADNASVTVSVNPLPTISAGPGVSICSGNSTTLSASGGVSYTWSPSDGLSCTNCSGPSANPTTTITYLLTGTDANGCMNTSDVTVTVNPLPAISSGPGLSICTGGNASLSASGGVSYSWSPSSGLSCLTCSSPTATPTVTTTYTVTGMNVYGCTNTSTVSVTVNPLPVISAGTNVRICAGGATTLTASGGVYYTWSPATGLSCFTCSGTLANPGVTTTYTVTGLNVYGCAGTSMVTVTVNALPAISAGSDVTICNGQHTLLSASGGVSYLWTPSTDLSCTNCSGTLADPSTTTAYTVTGTDANGCVNTAAVMVSVNPVPVVTAGYDVAICKGDVASLSASGGVSYVWSPAAGLSCLTCSTISASPTVTTTYTVTGMNTYGCANTAEVTVTINPLPTIAAGTGVSICTGGYTTLSASGGVFYTWSPTMSLSCFTCSGTMASPTVTTTYTVTGMNAYGCAGTAMVTVTVNPLPSISAGSDVGICSGSVTTISATSGLVSYSWTPSTGLFCNTCAATPASPSSTTTYSVTGVDGNGCSNTSSVTITVNALPSVSAGSGVSIAYGFSTTLNASGAQSYLWSPSASLSCSTCASPDASPTVTTTYSLTGTSSSGCSGSATVTVTVTGTPLVAPVANDITSSYVCNPNGTGKTGISAFSATDANAGGSIASYTIFTLPDPADGVLYYFDGTTDVAAVATQTITPTEAAHLKFDPVDGFIGNASFSYFATDNYSLSSNTVAFIIPVSALPAAGFSINTPTQNLSGNSFTFTNTGSTGSQYSYSYDFGNGATSSSISPVMSYTAAGTYTVTQTISITSGGCNASYAATVNVLSSGVGSGGGSGSGLESESLGGLVGERDFGYIKNSVSKQIDYAITPVFRHVDNAVARTTGTSSSGGILQRLVPATLNSATTPYITTPADITSITTAKDVFAIDYVENSYAKAVVLAITTLGKAYNHTKSICDRFRGATLLNTQVVTIKGYNFIQYTLRKDGNVEYCIAFDAGKSAGRNTFDLQANWLINQYAGDDSVFNFQAWAADPANTQLLVDKMLGNLSSIMPVQQIDKNFKVPPAYIAAGVRNKGSLDITITNNTPITSALLHFDERVNEAAGVDNLDLPLTLTTGATNKISIPIKDGYEYPGSLYLNGELVDVVYMADGNWSVDYDHSLSHVTSTPANEPDRVYVDNEYTVYRSMTIDATSADYISIYKFISSADDGADLTAYHSFRFKSQAQGIGKVTVKLIKSSITNWDDQYQATVALSPDATNYAISFEDFVSTRSNIPFEPSDVTAVVYYFAMGGVNTSLHFFTGSLAFSTDIVLSQRKLESRTLSILPNPSQGNFECKFESDASRLVDLVISDITGRVVFSEKVQAAVGSNTVQVSLPPAAKGTAAYIISLGDENMKYTPVKIAVTQ